MMKRGTVPKWAACLTALWLVSALSYSQGTPTQQAVPQQLRAAPTEEVEQVHVLEAQLKLMREYDERLLVTVYWSLATVATITLILVGFGWFVNFRVYERDKVSIRRELSVLLSEDLAKVEVRLQSTHSQAIAQLSEQLRQHVERQVAAISSKLDSATDELCEINFKLCEREAERSVRVPDNVFRYAGQMLSWALRARNEWRVGLALDRMLSALKQGARPNATMIMDVDPLLREVPTVHRVSAKAIEAALQQLRSRVTEADD